MPTQHQLDKHQMPAWRRACLAGALLACASPVLAQNNRVAKPEAGECVLGERTPPRAVVEVATADTILLDDGTRVRLAGTLAPRPTDSLAAVSFWQPEADAKAELTRLVTGKTVTLRPVNRHPDRHGRILAHVFVGPSDEPERWLQGELLAAGHARAHGIPGSYTCMDALLAAEAIARDAGHGLWTNPAYVILSATRTYDLMRLAGTYQVVDGVVSKAQRIKSGRIYLNFGSDWRDDFSASIAVSLSRSHPSWSSSLVDLAGKRVRIRGWILRRNGPMIELEHPSQLELIGPLPASEPEADTAAPALPQP